MVHLEPSVQAPADAGAVAPVDARADLASCRLTSAYRSRSPVRSDRSPTSQTSGSRSGLVLEPRFPTLPASAASAPAGSERWRHLVLYDDDHCGGFRPLLGHVSGMAPCVGSRSRRTLGLPPLDRGQQNRKNGTAGRLRIVRPAAGPGGERMSPDGRADPA